MEGRKHLWRSASSWHSSYVVRRPAEPYSHSHAGRGSRRPYGRPSLWRPVQHQWWGLKASIMNEIEVKEMLDYLSGKYDNWTPEKDWNEVVGSHCHTPFSPSSNMVPGLADPVRSRFIFHLFAPRWDLGYNVGRHLHYRFLTVIFCI